MPARLIYLHGFLSSPCSAKAQELARHADSGGRAPAIVIPALPDTPAAALGAAEAAVADAVAGGPVALVGSSMGGFYATVLAERYGLRAVLVNPSVHPHRRLQRYYGWHTNPYTGAVARIGPDAAAELEAMAPAAIDPARYWLLVQTGDETLDYREAVALYAGARHTVEPGGNHRFIGFNRHLPEIFNFLQCAPGTQR